MTEIQTMRQALGTAGGFMLFRVGAMQAGAMGGLGLLLAVIGVYGVVSYGASQRTREIGIRMALGARPYDVLHMILRQGVLLVAGGIVAGLAASALITRVMSRFVPLTGATDVVTFAAVTALLSFIALGACYLPARSAMRVDPIAALRHE
jgi:ABC-type antimicrobial peptide transport system permease subunit